MKFALGDGAELRRLRLEDAGELFALVDRNRARLREWLPWVDATRTSADTRGFIQRTLDQWERNQGFTGCIVVDGRIAGVVGAAFIHWANGATRLGYWLGEEFEGRGLVTRAVHALTRYSFDDLGLHRMEIFCAVGNARSRAIPERLGFREEGVLRDAERLYDRYVDVVVYARLVSDSPMPDLG